MKSEIAKFVDFHGIENVRFMVPMRKIVRHYNFGFIKLNSYAGGEKVIEECIITEDPKETRYTLEENYKVTLKSLDSGRMEHYYISDLQSLIFRDGSIKMEAKPAFL